MKTEPPKIQTFVDTEQTIRVDPRRGADDRLDYASLLRFGPWDDRNYQLILEDLAVLSPDEETLREPIPAFYRVMMRRASPHLPTTGKAQYPRSALQNFRQQFGGYLVNGKLYRGVQRSSGRYAVVLDDGVSQQAFVDNGSEALSGEVRITSPVGASESAIKISPVDSDLVIAGTNGPDGGQKMHYSTDGGETWTQVDLPLGGTCCDPGVDWSSDGSLAYAVALGNCMFGSCAVFFYRSDDGGQTWNDLEDATPGDPRRELVITGGDKEFMHVDQFATSPHKDNIYITWHSGRVMQFARSIDFGNTFATQSFSNDPANQGIGSDITTDHNGRIFYIWPGTDTGTIRLIRSDDGGVTFGAISQIADTEASFIYPIPSMETREVFVYVAADTDRSGGSFHGSVYAAWSDTTGPESANPADNHSRITVGYSHDGGDTWATSTPHETADANTVDRWHPWLTVGPDGTVHVVYYDTRRDPSRTSVDLFYSFSTDGAVTWSTPERVTTEQSPNITDGFEFGDYNGLDIVMDNLIAVFTDNRQEGGGSGDSEDVYGAGITPGGGAFCGNGTIDPGEACDGSNTGGQACSDFSCAAGSLACAADCSALDASACSLCSGADRVEVPLLLDYTDPNLSLSWGAACAGTDYAIYEGQIGAWTSQIPVQCSTGGMTSATIAPAAGSRFYLVVPTDGSDEGSYGVDSSGLERGASLAACLPQQITACP